MTPEEPEGMPEALRSRIADFLDQEIRKEWDLAFEATKDNRPRWTVKDWSDAVGIEATNPTDPTLYPLAVASFFHGYEPPRWLLDHVVRQDPCKVVQDCATKHLLVSVFRSSEPSPLDSVILRLVRAYQDSPEWSDDFLG
jgi:hypothetical protein